MSKNDTRLISFDYLRAFIIVLVLLYHSVLAYTGFFEISPLIDARQWTGFNFVIWFLDSFFMALLFLISGIFVWPSLKRKGIKIFLRDRFLKLGLPFLLLTFLAYLFNIAATVGHLWFLWVLLEYNIFISIIYKFLPKLETILQSDKLKIMRSPLKFCLSLIIISTLAYLPMAIPLGAEERLFFYLVYFMFGIWLGSQEIDNTILKTDSPLIKKWLVWLSASVIIFVLRYLFGLLEEPQSIFSLIAYAINSATITMSIIAVFIKFAKKSINILDNLSSNAYGIYIIHYGPVILLQYYLLNINIAAFYKVILVFVTTLIFSWGFVNIARRIKIIKKY